MDEVPPLYHGHDPFPVRGSFQPIDLGQNSDNEDAESWLVAPTPQAGSFCSQYWAPGTKSVYDDDISPTMSCRSSLAGDAFPPLNQSPDPNLASMPNSARSTGRYQGMRNSTSRIPRPSNGPPSARANDPMRQSMPTFPSRGKVASPAAPYRPSSGNYPPGSRGTTPAQRNLAARQAELRASIARQNEVRASLGRGGGTPGGASRGGRQPGAGRGTPGQGASHASGPGQSKAPGQVERAPSSRIGAGSAPANGYAAKFAKAPSARGAAGAQQTPGGVRTPATAPPATHQAKQAAHSSPSPHASPSPELPMPSKLSPYLSAAEDAKAAKRAAAHDQDDEDMRSAHSGELDHEEQPESPPPRPVQPYEEQSKEKGNSKGGPAESNGQSSGSPALQQQQQQHKEVKHKGDVSPQQQKAKEQRQPQQQQQQQQQQHESKQADIQPLRGPSTVSTPKAMGNGGPPTPTGSKEVTPRGALRQELTGFSSLTGQVLAPVDEQKQADMQQLQSPLSPTAQVVPADAVANVSVPSTPACASQGPEEGSKGAKGASEISPASPIIPVPPPRHESKSVPIGTSVSESKVWGPQFGPDETEDAVTAMGSTVVNVGDKSYSMRDDVPSASVTHQGWELGNSASAPSLTDTPKEAQQPQQQAQQQQGEKGSEEKKPAAPAKGKTTKDAKEQPECKCSIM